MLTQEPIAQPELITPFSENATGLWYLLRTRSRQEKIIATELAGREVRHYLPLVSSLRYYGNRKATVEVPLFPGYIFLRGSLDDAYALDRAGRIAQIIPITDQKKVHWELQNISLALDNSADLSYFPYLKKGVRVEVRSGPFQGLQGLIEEESKRGQLILQVDILGRAVSLEINGALLDVVE